MTNIIDGKAQTEYSSNAKGTDTFIEFDFGAPASVAAFRHVDRNDPATIASSELTFLDDSGARRRQGAGQACEPARRGDFPDAALACDGAARALAGDRVGGGPPDRRRGGDRFLHAPGKTESLPTGITVESRAPQIAGAAGRGAGPAAQGHGQLPVCRAGDGRGPPRGRRGQAGRPQVRQPER